MTAQDCTAKAKRAAYSKAYEAANKEKLRVRRAAYYAANKEKYRVRAAAYYQQNRDAYKDRHDRWLKENPERAREYFASYYLENKEAYRNRERIAIAKDPMKYLARKAAERARNPAACKAAFARWRAKNLPIVIHHNGLRRTRKARATPAWADLDAIRALYLEAAAASSKTGVKHHVDHIVPIRHPRVCGLHVHANLRVIPAAANHSKGNKLLEL